MILSGAIQDESTPNGKRWKECIAPVPESSKKIFHDICEDTYGNYWAAGEDGIYFYKKNIAQWNKVINSVERKFILIDVWTSGIAATEDGQIYISKNINSEEKSSWTFGSSVNKPYQINCNGAGSIFAYSTFYGEFKYSSNGAIWTNLPWQVSQYNSNSFYLDNGCMYLGTTGGIYYYDKSGDTFILSSGTSTEKNYFVDPIAKGYAICGNILYYSSDNGKSWTASSTLLPERDSSYLIRNKKICNSKGGTNKVYSCDKTSLTESTCPIDLGGANDSVKLISTGFIINNKGECGLIGFNKIEKPIDYNIYAICKNWVATDKGITQITENNKILPIETLVSSILTHGNMWIIDKYHSRDGKNWELNQLALKNNIHYLGGIYFCNVSKNSSSGNDYYSLDGINWMPMRKFSSIAYDGSGIWVLSGSNGYYWSNDGITWTKESTGVTTNGVVYASIYYGGGIWLGENCSGYSNYYSLNGKTWTQSNISIDTSSIGSATLKFYYSESKNLWLASCPINNKYGWYYSYDGKLWTKQTSSNYLKLNTIIERDGQLFCQNSSNNWHLILRNDNGISVQNYGQYETYDYNEGIWIRTSQYSTTQTLVSKSSGPLSSSSTWTDSILSLRIPHVHYFKGIWLIQGVDSNGIGVSYISKDGSKWEEAKNIKMMIKKAINADGILIAQDYNNQLYYSETLI